MGTNKQNGSLIRKKLSTLQHIQIRTFVAHTKVLSPQLLWNKLSRAVKVMRINASSLTVRSQWRSSMIIHIERRRSLFRFLSLRIVVLLIFASFQGPKVTELSDLRANLSEITSVQSDRVMRIFVGTREQVQIIKFSKLTS